jgi:predicted nucleic acid-binding protein
MQRAVGLVERHGEPIAARDAVHAATKLNNGLTRLLSADAHFDTITGIIRVDPRKATRL